MLPFRIVANSGFYPAVGLKKPSSVYITWGSHDQLSDTVELTEQLALQQLDEMIRLKQQGMKFDYFLMDMFWFDKHEGYRKFNQKNWPAGPDTWLEKCHQNGILPGLWLSTNLMGWGNMRWMLPKEEWKESLCLDNSALCLFMGGYLAHMIDTMQMWYDKGIRLFKFDFANFDAAPAELSKSFSEREIIELNEKAWHTALKLFRDKNPSVVLMAYNGYGGQQSDTHVEFRKTVDHKWLEVFDSLYCGDPRPADVPCQNFWRSKDIYSCHMVFQYKMNGIPLERIDNTAFMIGTTGTCYYRKKEAWKGMMILSGARGGWMNTYYGNLDLLTNDDAQWAAKVQSMFYQLQEYGRFDTFGAIPGSAMPYGYLARGHEGSLITLVNGSQQIMKIDFPAQKHSGNQLLFTDSGFMPELTDESIVLGPEQMAVIGFGEYSKEKYQLGKSEDVVIPKTVEPVVLEMDPSSEGKWHGIVRPKPTCDLRVVFRFVDGHGKPVRITGGEFSGRVTMSNKLNVSMFQGKKVLPLKTNYDKKIWSGLSWAVAELAAGSFDPNKPVMVELSADPNQVNKAVMQAFAFNIKY
jgi:hypothetical protein